MPLRTTTEFVNRLVNEKYFVRVPAWQRMTPDYEPVRTDSMAAHLQQGDVLFDIGVSDGWLSAIYAQFVGAENMVLFEPAPNTWPTIKAIWEENQLPKPLDTFCGLVGDRSTIPSEPDHDMRKHEGWPASAYGDELREEMQFRNIKERLNDTPMISIDDYVARTGIVPKAISIDVEGAEVLVLRGAQKTITTYKPLLWVSVHTVNGAIFYSYGHTLMDVFQAIRGCCPYNRTWLEVDGDEHWLF